MLEGGGVLPEEDGNQLREYMVMHEENFLSNWLREDMEGEKVEMEKLNQEARQEGSESGKREVEGERGGQHVTKGEKVARKTATEGKV